MSSYPWILTTTLLIGVTAATALALGRAPGAHRAGVAAATVAVLAGGTGVAALLAGRGVLEAGPGDPVPWIGVVITLALVGFLAASRLPLVRRALVAPGGLAHLTLLHTFRIAPGLTFLLLYADGRLPAVFALPAGIGDVAAGLAAPFVARYLARHPGSRAVPFQVLGAMDLVVALTTGFAVAAGPYQLMPTTPDGSLLAALPLALVPTVAVPLALAAHVVSLLSRRPAAVAVG
jgi:hypothetical protein